MTPRSLGSDYQRVDFVSSRGTASGRAGNQGRDLGAIWQYLKDSGAVKTFRILQCRNGW